MTRHEKTDHEFFVEMDARFTREWDETNRRKLSAGQKPDDKPNRNMFLLLQGSK